MHLDYRGPKIDVKDYMYNETRFKMVEKMNKNSAKKFLETARHTAQTQYKRYKTLEEEYEPKTVN